MKATEQVVDKFESSLLFKSCYYRFISFLKLSKHHFTSKELEIAFSINGSQLRKLAQYARRKGELICSGDKGYSYSLNKNEINSTLIHLKRRVASMQETINAIENSNHYKNLK